MESNDWLEDNKSITRNSNNNLNKEENKEIIYDDINDAFDKIVKHYEERKKIPVITEITEIKQEYVNKVANKVANEIKPKKNNTNKNIKQNKIKVNNNYDDYDDYDDTYDDYYD